MRTTSSGAATTSSLGCSSTAARAIHYGYNDYIYTYGTEVAYGYTQLPFYSGGRMSGIGVFADDSYKLGSRTTLNLGLRFDTSKGYFAALPILDQAGQPTGQTSPAMDELFRWTNASPRLGVNFKLNKSGSSLLKAHYGRYYRGIVTGEFDADAIITARYVFSGLSHPVGCPSGRNW